MVNRLLELSYILLLEIKSQLFKIWFRAVLDMCLFAHWQENDTLIKKKLVFCVLIEGSACVRRLWANWNFHTRFVNKMADAYQYLWYGCTVIKSPLTFFQPTLFSSETRRTIKETSNSSQQSVWVKKTSLNTRMCHKSLR